MSQVPKSSILFKEGPLHFRVEDAKRMHRTLPHFTIGLLWAGQQFVADEFLQHQIENRRDELRVALIVRANPGATPIELDISRSRGTVQIVVLIDSYGRHRPADSVMDGVALVVSAYAEAAKRKKLPRSAYLDSLAQRAAVEEIHKDLPARRDWVGRVIRFRFPESEYNPDPMVAFKKSIEQVSGEVEIHLHTSTYDPRDPQAHVWTVALYTTGPVDAVLDLITAAVAETGAPQQFEIVEEDWLAALSDVGEPIHGATGETSDGKVDSELLVEIHVPLRQGTLAWIDGVEEFLAGLGHGARTYDDSEEWHNDDGAAEYLFFVHNADEKTLLQIASDVAQLPGVPAGVYAVVNRTDGDMGAGRRVALADGASAPPSE